MRISDWSSDVCSSDLTGGLGDLREAERGRGHRNDAGTRADYRRTEGDIGEFATELLGDEEATLSADRPLVVADRLDLRLDVGLRVALVPHGLHVRGQVGEQAVDLRTHGVRVAGRVVADLAGAVVRVEEFGRGHG